MAKAANIGKEYPENLDNNLSNFLIASCILLSVEAGIENITPPAGPGGIPIVVGIGMLINTLAKARKIESSEVKVDTALVAESIVLYILFNCLTILFFLETIMYNKNIGVNVID